MKQYDSYKDSGVQWIGEIPIHWEVMSLKRLLEKPLQYGANEPAEDINENHPRYIRITDITDDGKLRDDSWKSLSPQKAQDYLLEKGNVLFARSGATVGKTYLFDENYSACFAGYLIKASCSKQILPMYLLYYTQSGLYNNWKNSVFIQSTIQNIGADKYSYLPITLPQPSEQHAIVTYLYKKCAEIDKAIATQQKRIELLQELRQNIITHAVTRGINPDVPLKDSGVEWIGMVPEHWEIRKLKYIAILQSGNTISFDDFTDEGFPVYGGNGFRGYTNKYNVEGEHVLIGRQGALCGNINYAKGQFFASEHAIVVYPYIKENIMWLGELLRISDLNQYSLTAAQPGIAVSEIKNIYYPYPPQEERQSIGSIIAETNHKIEPAIAKANRQISLLQELKQSIITEVVTGKRKVC